MVKRHFRATLAAHSRRPQRPSESGADQGTGQGVARARLAALGAIV
jgi:hypothetical protein